MIKTSGFRSVSVRGRNGWEFTPRAIYSSNFFGNGRQSQMRFESDSNLQGQNWSVDAWREQRRLNSAFRDSQRSFRDRY